MTTRIDPDSALKTALDFSDSTAAHQALRDLYDWHASDGYLPRYPASGPEIAETMPGPYAFRFGRLCCALDSEDRRAYFSALNALIALGPIDALDFSRVELRTLGSALTEARPNPSTEERIRVALRHCDVADIDRVAAVLLGALES